MNPSASTHTTALATDLIVRFPQAMRAVLELLAAIPPAQWPIELEALQRSAQALERVRLAHALLEQVCGPAPATASAIQAHVTDDRPAGGVHAAYQIGGPLGSKLTVALDHLSAELVIAQHQVGLDAQGPAWRAVLRDLRALLNDSRVGTLLDGPPAQPAHSNA
ncbi:MAG: hypothetical protein HGA45_23270 [Chloroflexales bacterium]|nr:hypothetical protein [Chloroflexales bacterium]